MNLQAINPFFVIQEMQRKMEDLENENKKLKEQIQDKEVAYNVDNSNNRQN